MGLDPGGHQVLSVSPHHSMATQDSEQLGDPSGETRRKGGLVPSFRSLSYRGKEGIDTKRRQQSQGIKGKDCCGRGLACWEKVVKDGWVD